MKSGRYTKLADCFRTTPAPPVKPVPVTPLDARAEMKFSKFKLRYRYSYSRASTVPVIPYKPIDVLQMQAIVVAMANVRYHLFQ